MGLLEGLRNKLRRTRLQIAPDDSEEQQSTAVRTSKDTPDHRRGRSLPGGQRGAPKQRRPARQGGSSTQALQAQFLYLQEQYVLLMGGLAKRRNAAAEAAAAAAATAAASHRSPRGGAPQPLQPPRDQHARLVNLLQRRPPKPPTPSQLPAPQPGSPSTTPAAPSGGRPRPPKATGAPPKSPPPRSSPGLKRPPDAARQGQRQRSVSLAAEAPASRKPRPPRKTFTAQRPAWAAGPPAAAPAQRAPSAVSVCVDKSYVPLKCVT